MYKQTTQKKPDMIVNGIPFSGLGVIIIGRRGGGG